MSRPTETNSAGFRFYDPANEKSATERERKLNAIGNDIGFELLRAEFSYQLHVNVDSKILDPKLDAHERQVLVEARKLLVTCLEPSILVDRGAKRAASEMKRAEADHKRATQGQQ